MSDSLGGARVALLEARMETELASLVRRHGGEPLCVPALREVERECTGDVGRAIDVVSRGAAVVVLATGVGLVRWLAVADTLSRGTEVREGIRRSTVVCRGPKPLAVLKREALPVHVRAESPHTNKELVAALDHVVVRDLDAVVIHDGGASRAVPDALTDRGARVTEVQPYGWALPEDIGPLRELIHGIVEGRIDAVAFTTQVQARHLFDVATGMGLRDALARTLRERTLVAAVGPTCARMLEDLGAPAHVVPLQPKMGAMVIAMAERLTAGR